jgi:hypothetical protein
MSRRFYENNTLRGGFETILSVSKERRVLHIVVTPSNDGKSLYNFEVNCDP